MSNCVRVIDPVAVVDAPSITILEHFGGVATPGRAELSACVVTVRAASEEAYQTPEFDEYVIVLEGEVTIVVDGNVAEKLLVRAGQGVFLPKRTRVKWIWTGPCKYVPICTPAFSPSNCGREEEEGNHLAKTSAAMDKLHSLHGAAAGAAHAAGGSAGGAAEREHSAFWTGASCGVVAGALLALAAARYRRQ